MRIYVNLTCTSKIGFALIGSLVLQMASTAAANFGSGERARKRVTDRAHIVVAKNLPALDGSHLRATLVEVNYAPGESSSPHSHPCAVIGYVAQGSIRTQVKGEPEVIYKVGETFYEAPGGVHLVSANASSTEPAKLLAYLICDHDSPLSVDAPEETHDSGGRK